MKKTVYYVLLFVIFILSIGLTLGIKENSTGTSTRPETIRFQDLDTVPKVIEVLYCKDDYDSLIIMLKKWEGFRSVKYRDADGFAIGYGHHIKDYETNFPDSISIAYAEKILRKDLNKLIDYTYNLTGLTGKRLLAVSALLFNTGNLKFSQSTLLRYIESENDLVATEWKKWCHYRKDGEVIRSKHLLLRREWEVAFYNEGCNEEREFSRLGSRFTGRCDSIQVSKDSIIRIFDRTGFGVLSYLQLPNTFGGRGKPI